MDSISRTQNNRLADCLIVMLLLLACVSVKAQDIITYKNGDEVKAKVTEVSPTEIKYKVWDNQDGPLYRVSKADIFMIKYENGTKDVMSSAPVAAPIPAITEEERKARMATEQARASFDYYKKMEKKYYSRGVGLLILGIHPALGGVAMLCTGAILSTGGRAGDPINVSLFVAGSLLTAGSVGLLAPSGIYFKKYRNFKKLAAEEKAKLVGFGPTMQYVAPGGNFPCTPAVAINIAF
ncbi:MAG: hypothetical protein U0T84_13730 [Chitinophagales bacterium]